jgi:hypothetical protein
MVRKPQASWQAPRNWQRWGPHDERLDPTTPAATHRIAPARGHLTLGLDDATDEGLATQRGNMRVAWDSFRRVIQGTAKPPSVSVPAPKMIITMPRMISSSCQPRPKVPEPHSEGVPCWYPLAGYG